MNGIVRAFPPGAVPGHRAKGLQEKPLPYFAGNAFSNSPQASAGSTSVARLLRIGLSALVLILPELAQTAKASQATPLETACQSNLPWMVVDNHKPEGDAMYPKAVDVNGDGENDDWHGPFIQRLFDLQGRTTLPLNLNGETGMVEVARVMNRIADDIEKSIAETGRPHISAVSFSQEIPMSFEGLNQIGLPLTITPENIAEHKAMIVESIAAKWPQLSITPLVEALSRIEALGIPVINIAGNNNPKFNFINLFPGIISIGSLSLQGDKVAASSDNSLVTLWRPGQIAAVEVPGGIDLNGDGQPDYLSAELSSGESMIQRFTGQSVDVVQDIPASVPLMMAYSTGIAIQHLKDMKTLFPTDQLVRLYQIPEDQAERLLAQGQYTEPTFHAFFNDDGTGHLAFNDNGTSIDNLAAIISGTSFTPPRVCEGLNAN